MPFEDEPGADRSKGKEMVMTKVRDGGIYLMLLSMLLWCVPAVAADEPFDYPFTDPLVATVLGTPPAQRAPFAEHMDVKMLDLTIFPDRKIPGVFWYNSSLRCSLAKQKGKAPLIFVIAGTGSGFNSDTMLGLQSAFYRAGFHVISISSPTHANFITTASSTCMPGVLKDDAVDLYRVMEKAWTEVRTDIQVSNFCLTGYSLGGTEAAFVSMLDDEQKAFNFRKVLLINPAVSLYASTTRMDRMLEDNVPGGVAHISEFVQNLMDKLTRIYRSGSFVKFDHNFLYNVYRSTPDGLEDDNLAGVIGLAFRIAACNTIFSSDVMTHSGFVVPKNLVLHQSDSLEPYFRTLLHISYVQYMEEMVLPAAQARDPHITRQILIDSLSLKAIDSYLCTADKIGVLTNEDDFILDKSELDYLRQLFGDRAMIFPHGGHLGNLNQRQVVTSMTNFLTQSSTHQEAKP